MRRHLLSSSAFISLLVPGALLGQTALWVGGPAGNWSAGANWSTGIVPDSLTAVRIDGGDAQNAAVTIDIPATVRSIEISLGDTATLNNGLSLAFTPGLGADPVIFGPGNLFVGNAQGNAEVTALSQLFASGGGTLHLIGRSRVVSNAAIIQNPYSIVGSGRLSSAAHIVGQGSWLEARPTLGGVGTLATLNVVTPAIGNSGTLSAVSGGTLVLDTSSILISSSQGTFFLPGTLFAGSGSTIVLPRDIVLQNQILRSGTGGLLLASANEENNSITLNGVESHADFRSERMQNTIIGSLPNSGTVTFAAAGGSVQFNSATPTLSGGGLVRLHEASVVGLGTATLQQVSHTIAGSTGMGSLSTGSLINGTGSQIVADVAGKQLAVSANTLLVNSGTLAAINGGTLRLTGIAPLIDNRFGRIVARDAGSNVLIDQPVRVFGGVFETDADGEVVFDSPGGTLTIDNVVNLGRLRLQSGTLSGGPSSLIINAGTITTSGLITLESTITLLGSGQFNANARISYNGLINQSNRIGGSGEIESLDNRSSGIVEPDGTRLSLVGQSRNSGLMRAINGGTLILSATDNTGGRIEAASGSHVVLRTGINTGTLTALAGGSFTAALSGVAFGDGATLFGPGTFGSVSSPNPTAFRYQLSSGQAMTVGDNAILDGGTFSFSGSSTINLAGATRAVTLKDTAINVGAATLNIGPGTLNLQGRVINRANIHLRSSGNEFSGLAPIGVATLSGGGTIHGAGGAPGSGRLVNLDNKIFLGAPFFGNWSGGWENYGEITGQSGFSDLRVVRNSNSINRGLITAGLNLELAGTTSTSMPAILDNAGGVITTGGQNSRIALREIIVSGGMIDATEGKVVPSNLGVSRPTFHDLTLAGEGFHAQSGVLRLDSFIHFTPGTKITVGDISMAGGGLSFGDATLTGSGSIVLLPAGQISSGFVTLDSVSIVGAGTLGDGSLTLIVGPNSSVSARVLPGIPGSEVMNIRTKRLVNQGVLAVESGSRMNLLTGTDNFGVADAGGSISIQAGGVFSAEEHHNTSRIVNDGTLQVIASRLIAVTSGVEGNGVTRLTAGTLRAGRIQQTSLTLLGTARATIESSIGASRVNELSIEPNARLSLNRGALVIDYSGSSPLETVRELIASGFAGGSWNGNGITVSSIGFPIRRTAAGYAEATAIGLANGQFLGEPVDDTALLLRYTVYGDADLSGSVNLDDFTRLAAGFGSGTVWSQGDFNYDGVVNLDDFTALAANFGQTLPAEPARAAAVPEPLAGIAVVAMSGASLLCRRRR